MLQVLAYLNISRNYGLTFSSGESVLSVYCDADYAKRETDQRSVSRIMLTHGGVVVSSTSRTRRCVTLSTIETEYVAMTKGANERMSIRFCLSCDHRLY